MLIELRDALNTIWEVPTPELSGLKMISSFVKERLFSFALVLAIGFLLVVSGGKRVDCSARRIVGLHPSSTGSGLARPEFCCFLCHHHGLVLGDIQIPARCTNRMA